MSEMLPAHPKPCAHCPWRIENQGKRHAHGFYTKANLRRLWAGLRRGERMTCHPTDPRMAEFAGYEATEKREQTHECTGAVVLQQREAMRFQDACHEAEAEGAKDGLKRYRRAFPRGLTREGLAAVVWAATFGHVPLIGGLETAKPNLNQEGIGAPDVPDWEARTT